jgi:hypothetical protein
VSRTTILVLVALGAALAGFAFSSSARLASEDAPTPVASTAASPQRATLGWRETYGTAGEQLVFSVESLEVHERGWRAKLSLENRTTRSYGVASTLEQPFGLMMFANGDHEEFVRLNEDRSLPAVRPANRYEPKLPAVLEPGDSWVGTISAPGALAADTWVRIVFGALVTVPENRDTFAWITDHAYRLRA